MLLILFGSIPPKSFYEYIYITSLVQSIVINTQTEVVVLEESIIKKV